MEDDNLQFEFEEKREEVKAVGKYHLRLLLVLLLLGLLCLNIFNIFLLVSEDTIREIHTTSTKLLL